jgi:hypothetical protein
VNSIVLNALGQMVVAFWGCVAKQSGRNIPVFSRGLLPLSSAYPEDEGSGFFRNVGTFTPNYTILHLRRNSLIFTAVETSNLTLVNIFRTHADENREFCS